MNQSQKWLLSSGTCVEDVLYREGNRLPVESPLHSWVIDFDDWEIEQLFSKDDWCEIKSAFSKQPKVDEYFAKSLSRFANVSLIFSLSFHRFFLLFY